MMLIASRKKTFAHAHSVWCLAHKLKKKKLVTWTVMFGSQKFVVISALPPPHAKCQACWEGVAWVEPATTSKLLTRLHSHIKEKTVLLFGPISLMYVCCVLGRTLTSYHNNMEYNYAHLKMGYSLFRVLFGKKSGNHCCGFGCVQSPLRADCWFLLADEWWARYTCISKCVCTHCPNELAIIKIQHVLW